jgi:phage gpG-like protein
MSGGTFQANLAGLFELIASIDDSEIKRMLLDLPNHKKIHALISQAIAENFDKEGPGWKPLKIQTIMQSLPKKRRQEVKSGKVKPEAARKILQGSPPILKKSVTTPGVEGHVHRVEGTTLIWGTDLIYAGIHQHGGTIRRGEHTITIPARPYLKLSDFWKLEIETTAVNLALQAIRRRLGKVAA